MSSRSCSTSTAHRHMIRHAVIGCAVLTLFAVQPASAGAGPWDHEDTLVAADGSASDFLGWSVAVAGDTAFVGAWKAKISGNADQGAVYIFDRDGGFWTEQAKLVAADGRPLDTFGWDVALSGDNAVIGAPCGPFARCLFTGDISNWLLTPEVAIENGTELRFWTRTTPQSETFSDRLELRLSTAGGSVDVGDSSESVGDFTELLLTINEDLEPGVYPEEWTEFVVTVEGLSEATTGRFAFRHWVTDSGPDGMFGDYVGIDTVRVTQLGGASQVLQLPTATTRGDVEEGFDDIGTLPAAGWAIINNSEPPGEFDWFQGDPENFPSHEGAPHAYIAANFLGGGVHIPGAAYIFTRDGDTFAEQAKLKPSDGRQGDAFGKSVALAGDTVLVGAPGARVGDNEFQGAAYVYVRADGAWVEHAKLVAPDGASSDAFGGSVALAGDTALIGAGGADIGDNTDQGAVYVFVRDGETWSQQAKLTASDGAVGDFFGTVAISADTAIVGAQHADVGDNFDQGAAYVFVRSGEVWSEQAKLVASDGAIANTFGVVALRDDTALVGAPRGAGKAYVYERDGVSWTETAVLSLDGTGQLGASVTLSDKGILVLGAPATRVGDDTGQGVAAAFVRGVGAEAPIIEVDPPSLSAVLAEGEIESQQLSIGNPGDAPLEWELLPVEPCTSQPWVVVEPVAGTVPAGGVESAVVTFDTTGLQPGVYDANLCIRSNDPVRPLLLVPVTLTVADRDGFTPAALTVDPESVFSDGNGVLEPVEVVEVVPSWRNNGTIATSLTGSVSHLVGPEGADYALLLADADYGLVEPDQTAACLRGPDACYWLGVSAPAGRPATHWEASFEETLSDLAGTSHTWTLHIGDSFTDVPRSSPFYPAIESLLHHGVTGGCADAAYCPGGTNTRAQMAVFLLKAAEGADYIPPACVAGEERFDDVPADAPFCPWIQELAARDVVAGCDGANFCPGDPVTRAQMAIFLLKTREGGAYTPPPCSDVFSDVPCPSTFASWIEELVRREITSGCGASEYCPSASVTRQQMAVFLSRTFGLDLYGP